MGNFFNKVYNIWAWVWNHVWGTLFMVFGVYGLFSGIGVWQSLLCIGVGVYFFLSKRSEDKIGAAASKAASLAAAAVAQQVNKEKNTAIDRDATTPDVMKSSASVADVTAALDAVLSAKWFDPFHGSGLRTSERTAERIVYSFGTFKVPEAVRAEVRIGEAGGATQVVFTCLHQDDSNGLRSFAQLAVRLRESVEYAVAAAGDPARIAEGVRLYEAPEKGSLGARNVRNMKLAIVAGVALCISPLFMLQQGISADNFSQWVPLELLGAVVIWGATKSAKNSGIRHAVGAPSADASGAPGGPSASAPAPAAAVPASGSSDPVAAAQAAAAGAVEAAKSGAGAARTWFLGLGSKQRALVAVAAIVVIVGAGIAIGTRPNGSEFTSDGYAYEGDDYNAGETVADYTPVEDTADSEAPVSTDAVTEDDSAQQAITTNADPLTADEAQAIIARASTAADLISTYRGSGLYTKAVNFEGRVIEASHVLVFDNGDPDVPGQWAVQFNEVKMFYLYGNECTADEFYGEAVAGGNMPGTVGFDQGEVFCVTLGEE